ncbi:unnamed protein product [Periconia digitata]|uniref:Uncharacterized protein n=1 Tax=Periconia digitata TaxID=1303443 RepID=A0A9W4UPP6_9PLEO|nr:unnamed protein product [Periconia digitata]
MSTSKSAPPSAYTGRSSPLTLDAMYGGLLTTRSTSPDTCSVREIFGWFDGAREMFSTEIEAERWLKQAAVVKRVDDAWLGNLSKVHTLHRHNLQN